MFQLQLKLLIRLPLILSTHLGSIVWRIATGCALFPLFLARAASNLANCVCIHASACAHLRKGRTQIESSEYKVVLRAHYVVGERTYRLRSFLQIWWLWWTNAGCRSLSVRLTYLKSHVVFIVLQALLFRMVGYAFLKARVLRAIVRELPRILPRLERGRACFSKHAPKSLPGVSVARNTGTSIRDPQLL